MTTEIGYIVRLEPGVWLCPEEEDAMGRTLLRKWAAVYPTEGETQQALAAARRYRAFTCARIPDSVRAFWLQNWRVGSRLSAATLDIDHFPRQWARH